MGQLVEVISENAETLECCPELGPVTEEIANRSQNSPVKIIRIATIRTAELDLRPGRIARHIGTIGPAALPVEIEQHVPAKIIPQQAGKKVMGLLGMRRALLALLAQCLGRRPCFLAYQRIMDALVGCAVAADLADINRIAKDAVYGYGRHRGAAARETPTRQLDRAAIACLAHGRHHRSVSPGPQELGEDEAHDPGLSFIHTKAVLASDIAKWRQAAVDASMTFSGTDAVADPLGNQFALELRKGEQHVENHPAHAVGGVKSLGD